MALLSLTRLVLHSALKTSTQSIVGKYWNATHRCTYIETDSGDINGE